MPRSGSSSRLRPLEPLAGRRVAVFTAGPAPLDQLDGIVFASRNLADRERLRHDLVRPTPTSTSSS